MYLEYVGCKAELTLTLPWLKGGPYTFTQEAPVVEVDETDGGRLLVENPGSFLEAAGAPAQEASTASKGQTKQDIMDQLDAMGVEYDKSMKKADLQVLLKEEW